ncbi:unnamed protein product [Brachionus calyciflorus]|uniref:Uncharacterized protein n=1 Tax=Brachionus calyciflorus TaxID=104777 RepID=A0A813YB99_9BILA|nr:unnamed protein product [Brachionus calyciflorus]
MNSKEKFLKEAPKLTYEQIVSDLASIPLNENDVLFDSKINFALENKDSKLSENEQFNKRLENLVIFKTNLEFENDKLGSELSLDSVNKDLDNLESHINSLQHFIEISRKFHSLQK